MKMRRLLMVVLGFVSSIGCYDVRVRRDAYVGDDAFIRDNVTVGGTLTVVDEYGNPVFMVDENGQIRTGGGLTVTDPEGTPVAVISNDGSIDAEGPITTPEVIAGVVDAVTVIVTDPIVTRSHLTVNGLPLTGETINATVGVALILNASQVLSDGPGTFTFNWWREETLLGTGLVFVLVPTQSNVGSLDLVLEIVSGDRLIAEIIILINVRVVDPPPPPPPPPLAAATVVLSVQQASVVEGTPVVLISTITNAIGSCTAFGTPAWTGPRAGTSSPHSILGLVVGTHSLGLTCVGPNGVPVTGTVTVVVTALPQSETLMITGNVAVSGTLKAGQEVTLTIPTNGGDGSVSFKFLDMALSFAIFIEDGEIVHPSVQSGKFSINAGGVVTIKYTLTLSGTGSLRVWANDNNLLNPPVVISIPMTVVP